jgi:hypothetical protein
MGVRGAMGLGLLLSTACAFQVDYGQRGTTADGGDTVDDAGVADGAIDAAMATEARCGDGVRIPGLEDCDPPGAACSTSCIAACPGFEDPTTGHCYERLDTPMDWETARLTCGAQLGRHLAVFSLYDEWNRVAEQPASLAGEYWIGLTDQASEGGLAWVTAEEDNVSVGGIDGLEAEDCMHRITFPFIGWQDAVCTMPRISLCELEPPLYGASGRGYRIYFPLGDRASAAARCSEAGLVLAPNDADTLADFEAFGYYGRLWFAGLEDATFCESLGRSVGGMSQVRLNMCTDLLPVMCAWLPPG